MSGSRDDRGDARITQVTAAGIDAPGDLQAGDLRALYRFWLDLRGGGRLPPVGAIEPIHLQPWLGLLAVCEIVQDPASILPFRIRYRLFGTALVQAIGRDLTGRYIEDGPCGADPVVADAYHQVARSGLARRLAGTFEAGRPVRRHRFEELLLPFADAGGGVARLLLAVDFQPAG